MDSKEENHFVCPVCGGYLATHGFGDIRGDDNRSWPVEYTGVIHPQLGLKAQIEAKTTPTREFSLVIEDPRHGKVSCIENEAHVIPQELVDQLSSITRGKRGRVPIKTVSGGLIIFKSNNEIQEAVFDFISEWYEKMYPTIP